MNWSDGHKIPFDAHLETSEGGRRACLRYGDTQGQGRVRERTEGNVAGGVQPFWVRGPEAGMRTKKEDRYLEENSLSRL